MSRTAEPYFPPGLVDYLEEKEAMETLMDKSRDLALEFASVKVEFCDLDGLGWEKRHPAIGEQTSPLPVSSPFPTRRSHEQSATYLPSRPKISPERKNGSPPNKDATRGIRRSVTRVRAVEVEDCSDGPTYIHYTGGIPLSRSESSTRVPFGNACEFDDPSSSAEEMDDLETPQPLHTIMEDSADFSYFGANTSFSRPSQPIKMPTVPSVPYPPRFTSPS
ncbi:hypothetical protein L218DRAFT_1080355 [Marasmius fiardii PR-910]|nr:hypothetical protein L218DRAFT_1080355 [Marasmius fiardii PR-910]